MTSVVLYGAVGGQGLEDDGDTNRVWEAHIGDTTNIKYA